MGQTDIVCVCIQWVVVVAVLL